MRNCETGQSPIQRLDLDWAAILCLVGRVKLRETNLDNGRQLVCDGLGSSGEGQLVDTGRQIDRVGLLTRERFAGWQSTSPEHLLALPAGTARILQCDMATLGPRDVALDVDEILLGIDTDDEQVVDSAVLVASHAARHFGAWPHTAWVLVGTGGTVTSVRDRDTVRRSQTVEAVSLHDTLEAVTAGDGAHVHRLTRNKVDRRELGAEGHDRIRADRELADDLLALGDAGGLEMALNLLCDVFCRLGVDGGDLECGVGVGVGVGAETNVGRDLVGVNLEDGGRNSFAVGQEERGHTALDGDEADTLRSGLPLGRLLCLCGW